MRARAERPRDCRAAEQRDELVPFHSITSSVIASTLGGIVIPSALAVVRLDGEIEFGRLLDRNVARLGSAQNFVNILNTQLCERRRSRKPDCSRRSSLPGIQVAPPSTFMRGECRLAVSPLVRPVYARIF